MNSIRKIIREFLNEIFDSFKLPDSYKKENNIFYFQFNDLDYYVQFTPFSNAGEIMVSDEEILNIINNATNKFVIDFGIVQNGELNFSVNPKSSYGIELLRLVGGIILKFCQDKNVEVLSYVPNSERKNKLFNIISQSQEFGNYVRYRRKEKQSYSVFFITKNLMNENYK